MFLPANANPPEPELGFQNNAFVSIPAIKASEMPPK
jgi:hypothetical protein